MADYVNSSAGVSLDLAQGGNVGDAAGDSFFGVENVNGSAFADIIIGDARRQPRSPATTATTR